MPTYDYECGNCKHAFELYQSITAKPIRKCPSCGKNTAKRLIGIGGGVIFRGSGFYQTDYRSESYKKAAKAETDSKSGSTKTESASTAKSDAPAASKPSAGDGSPKKKKAD